jgi:hypothetical protein
MTIGILSNKRARKVRHDSVAMPQIQERRAKKKVLGGRPLHDYVNLYICARNKMLYKVKNKHLDLSVLRVHTGILDLPNVVVTDQNASSAYARFAPAPIGLQIVDRNRVFAEYWTHPGDPIAEWRHGSIKCAEVLVPDRVAPEFIMGAYVSCPEAKATFIATGVEMPVEINGHLFFR